MGEKNDLLSAVISDDIIDRVKHLVKYLSCRVFGQAIYRHVIYNISFFVKILRLHLFVRANILHIEEEQRCYTERLVDRI